MAFSETCWLYLARHGATDNNRADPPRLQGQRTDPALSDEGHRQAAETGRFLARVRVDAVYSSPLLRARETACAIAEPRGLSVQVLDGLVEIDVGQWEGRTWEEIQLADPEAYRAFMADPCTNPYLGGENIDTVRTRVVRTLTRLMADNPGRRIVAVAHNVVNRVYLAQVMGIPVARYRTIPQDNCGLTLLCHREAETRVVTLNSVFHLAPVLCELK